MSIVSKYNDYVNVFRPKRTGICPVGSFNIDEVDPVISTNASVKQVSSKYKSSVPSQVLNSSYVPLAFLTRDDTPRIFDNEAVESKLANGSEIDANNYKGPSKEIQELYNRVLSGGQLTAFNGVMINLPAQTMTR